MHAWKSWVLSYSVTAFAACGSIAFVSAASHCDPLPPEEAADSIPFNQKFLPEPSGVESQKPPDSPFSSGGVTTPGWRLEGSHSSLGFRKRSSGSAAVTTATTPGPSNSSAQKISADVITSVPRLPAGFSDRVTSFAMTDNPDGEGKPDQTSPPTIDAVVQVKWNAVSRSPQSDKVNRSGLNFQSEYCPFVLWDFSTPGGFLPEVIIDSASVGSCSDLSLKKDTAGHVQLASVPRFASSVSRNSVHSVHSDYLAELQHLRPDPAPQQISNAGEDYLSELNQLLQGQSNWLFANSDLLDLAPEEGVASGETYLDELNGLVKPPRKRSNPTGTVYRRTVSGPATSVLQAQFAAPQPNPESRYSSISPEQKCIASAGSGIGALFEPLGKIQVNGLSTAPPVRGGGVDSGESAELQRPENSSCAYLDDSTPVYYFVPSRYGACRPPRGVHELWHQPLYFEDPNLERCGRSHGCMTTAVSAAYFATAIAFTPYLTAANCPASCEKSLPDCPTCQSFGHEAYWPGWSWKGAAAEAAAVTGLIFIVP